MCSFMGIPKTVNILRDCLIIFTHINIDFTGIKYYFFEDTPVLRVFRFKRMIKHYKRFNWKEELG